MPSVYDNNDRQYVAAAFRQLVKCCMRAIAWVLLPLALAIVASVVFDDFRGSCAYAASVFFGGIEFGLVIAVALIERARTGSLAV